ncbi:MAG: MBL fold metallo-hydrolase [Acetobacter sp.]|nr:MBL fold metallo-hydrolase [Bacteroides sp.]MCM1340693.1 MBL fold metallo-hydrolase [Acetobacter sp.]MCM1433804.1 MBL fold metallo-hydrolase [Clostridiales bacterium]
MSRKKKNVKGVPALSSLLVIIIVAIIYFISGGAGDFKADKVENTHTSSEGIIVHYLDVGQGDSEFIEFPTGKCMLIDASISEYGSDIEDYIENLGYDRIDYLVATHPHADHIGGMEEIVESFDIGEIYMPRAVTTTKTYLDLLETVSEKNLTISTAKAGKVITDDNINIEFLAPVNDGYEDLNNFSAVLKITYNKSSFLFTGDAEELSEDEMLASSYSKLNSDVLKVGHHGSRYSSSTEFLQAVSPVYSVISCGKNNSYGHPHKEAISRLNAVNSEIYRTDELGTITIFTAGDGDYEVDYR